MPIVLVISAPRVPCSADVGEYQRVLVVSRPRISCSADVGE
jgi:hypothetical protein